MNTNAAVEQAEHRVELECAAGVARIQAAVRGQVPPSHKRSPYCAECGERIPDARRNAMPDAERCVDCETFIERQSRRRA